MTVPQLRAALDRQPEEPGLWCRLAQAHLAAGDAAEALAAADRAAHLAPEDERPHRLRSYALEVLGRHAQAIDAADAAVALAPDSWAAQARLADALTAGVDPHPSRLRTTRALSAAERAVLLAPGEPRAYRVLAQVHGRREDLVAMCAAEAAALSLAPGDAAVQNDIGVARARIGRLPAAGVAFARAATLDPRGPGAANFGAVLDQLFARRVHLLALAVSAGVPVARVSHGVLWPRVWAAAAALAVVAVLLPPVAELVRQSARRRRAGLLLALARLPRLAGLAGALAAGLALAATAVGTGSGVAAYGAAACFAAGAAAAWSTEAGTLSVRLSGDHGRYES